MSKDTLKKLDFKYDHTNSKGKICNYDCSKDFDLEEMKKEYIHHGEIERQKGEVDGIKKSIKSCEVFYEHCEVCKHCQDSFDGG